MNETWYVYIISNYKNTVFYTGITNNLKRRIWEHKKGIVKSSFSSKYKLYKLLWFEEFDNPKKAIENEKRVKDMRRERKISLIKEENPKFMDLMSLE